MTLPSTSAGRGGRLVRLPQDLKILIARFQDARRRCSENAKPQDRAYYRCKAFGFESPRHAARYMLETFGPIPPGMSIDRIDPHKGYEPGNLRYATPREQALNTRLHPRFWR